MTDQPNGLTYAEAGVDIDAGNALVDAIKAVLAEAVEVGGSSISDYAGADGALGYFQHSFRVYGREGEPCPDSCDGMVERVVQGGRSTFYCPRCQT